MKKTAIIISFIILLGAAWIGFISNKVKNHENANISKVGQYYEIELRGIRYLMVHDPISALMGKTYEAKHIIKVPRITGIVKGKEMLTKPGYYKYIGEVKFVEDRMIVDLYADNIDDKTKDPLSWNGEYLLINESR